MGEMGVGGWPRMLPTGSGRGRLSEKKLGEYTRQFAVVGGEARRRGGST